MKTFEAKLGRTFKTYLRNPPPGHEAALRSFVLLIANLVCEKNADCPNGGSGHPSWGRFSCSFHHFLRSNAAYREKESPSMSSSKRGPTAQH